MTLFTVGHGSLAEAELARLLRGAGVTHLVDVRSAPGSRRNPHLDRVQLERWLPEAGITYRWEPRLGGRRLRRPGSPNVALEHEAFRAYADHMARAEFAAALDELLAEAAEEPTAVMCAEALWWRCHRRLLADAAVLLRGARVLHLFHGGRLAVHEPMVEARVEDGHLVYDRGATPRLPGL
ncbi:MAG: DUF488 domain-containing protein [Acidimicrobiia bacterium]|nr:DUF488 domain-containing protein [Acidimicrobiia bacterium]